MYSVLAVPPVRYVTVGDESIAYRDFGGYGIPILFAGTNGCHQDLMWDEPGYAHFLRSLAALGRLVTLDRRGSGLSSRTLKPTIDIRVADIDRVLDATAIDRAVLVATVGSTHAALAFAAVRPGRTRALVLYCPHARMSCDVDYDIVVPGQEMEGMIAATEHVWGTGITAHIYTPSLADDPGFVEWAARYERSMATPVEARQMVEMYNESDVRDVLPLVRCRALVVTPALADAPAPQLSRYVADHLPNVQAIDIPARDQWPFGDGLDHLIDAATTFLVDIGDVQATHRSHRRLAAVLFTDLVASTERLQAVGDQRWQTTLDSHDDVAGRIVSRNGGRVVKSMGDGILAVFDGPASAVTAALDILSALRRIGLAARGGVHVGELEERGDDVSGIAVTLCSRINDRATADEVLVSSTVRDLVAGSGLQFETRGQQQLKGIDEPVELLAASTDRSVAT
jgi:class 3 adenylate cyclase/pimeloyl-ACP methyl ester carboxylesterase